MSQFNEYQLNFLTYEDNMGVLAPRSNDTNKEKVMLMNYVHTSDHSITQVYKTIEFPALDMMYRPGGTRWVGAR